MQLWLIMAIVIAILAVFFCSSKCNSNHCKFFNLEIRKFFGFGTVNNYCFGSFDELVSVGTVKNKENENDFKSKKENSGTGKRTSI